MKFSNWLKTPIIMTGLIGLTACSTIETAPELDSQPVSTPVSALERPAFLENENNPEGLSAELVYDLLLSSIAFQRGETQVASNALMRAAELSQDAVVISRAVRMAIHTKQYDQAFTLGQRWIVLEDKNHMAKIVTALAATLAEKSDEAIKILLALIDEDEEQSGRRFQQIGEVFLRNSDGDAPINVLQQLASEHPKLSEGWMVVAGMAQKNSDLDAMRVALDKVLVLEPDNQNAAAYQLEALSEDQTAQHDFAQKFIERNPKALNFRLRYARSLLREDQEEQALQALLDLLDQDAENSEAINLVALLYQSQSNHEKAAVYFKRRLKAMPDDDRSRVYLANALQQLERFDEAKAQLDKVKDERELFSAQRQMALVIEQADGTEKAMFYLKSLEGQDQAQKVQLIVDQELMLKRAGREDEALALINQGLEQYTDNETLIYHRALVTIEQQNLAAHEADMRNLLARKPENAHYQNTLGYSLLTLSDRIDEAGILIDKAHKLAPEDPYILDSKGWLEFKKGNIDIALEFLDQAFKLDQDAEIAAHIGEIYWTKGDQDKAKDFWKQGDKIDADNKALQETKARFLN